MLESSSPQETIAAFLRQLAEADRRAGGLRSRWETSAVESPALLEETFEELDIALEELHATEEELRQQNEALLTAKQQLEVERYQYVELFQAAPFGYLVTDRLGIIQEANHAAGTLLRRPLPFLTGKPLSIFVAEEHRGELRALLHRLGKDPGRRERVRTVFHPSGGSPFLAELTAEPGKRAGSDLVVIRWVVRDRSEDADLEAEHHRAQRMLAALTAGVEEAFVGVDAAGRVILWSPGAELLFGWSAAELMRQPVPLSLGEPIEGEQALSRKDDSTISARVTAIPLTMPSGERWGTLFRIAPLTEQPDRPRLRDLRSAALLPQLAGGMGHHLNNLMTVVLASADLARRGLPPGTPELKDLQEVREATLRAASFTRALVAYSGKEVNRPRNVDFNAVVWRALADASSGLPASIHCYTSLDPALPPTRIDPAQLTGVVRELIANAIQAMPAGGSLVLETFLVSAERAGLRQDGQSPTEFVQLAVHDSGQGMDEETRSRVFEPFFTHGMPECPPGLGLAAAWGIVSQAGGFIRVESQTGTGTSFRVFVPVASPSRPSLPAGRGEAGDEMI